MKITYITHACILIETNGLKILTDPWLVGPCWGGDLWNFPKHKFEINKMPKPDIIFFSHGHDDHFHETSIANFPKTWMNSLVVTPKFGVEWWEKEVTKKFKNVYFFNHNEKKSFKGVELQIFVNDRGDFDSSLKISDKHSSVFLQTDNIMSLQEAKRIRKYGNIDFAFLIPFHTGCFPGFYKMNMKKKIEESKKKNLRAMEYSAKISKNLGANYTIPYACDMGYLGDKFHLNLIHSHDKTEYLKVLKKKKITTKPLILNSGDFLKKDKNKIKIKKTPYVYSQKKLLEFYQDSFASYQKSNSEELNASKKTFKEIVNTFKNKINFFLRKSKLNDFKVKFNILEKDTEKKDKFVIDLKTKKIKTSNLDKVDLIIDIFSYKLANLLEKKYPMNFLTFHNGGYVAQRFTKVYSKKEKEFWDWIYNLNF